MNHREFDLSRVGILGSILSVSVLAICCALFYNFLFKDNINKLLSSPHTMARAATISPAQARSSVNEDMRPSTVVGPEMLGDYPAAFPMQNLLEPVFRATVRCDESMSAGKHILAKGASFPYQKYSKGGIEITYEARDDQGQPCVYPFAPWIPVRGSGQNDWPSGSQFIWRTDTPGVRARFQSSHAWHAWHLKAGKSDGMRYHAELRDIGMEFEANKQKKGSIQFEAIASAKSGAVFTLALFNVSATGGKNVIFVDKGPVMVFIEGGEFRKNLAPHIDQEHIVYASGPLYFHARNASFFGAKGNKNAGGHVLKVKAAVTVLDNVSVSNAGGLGSPTPMPPVDLTATSFVWTRNLVLERDEPDAPVRDGLIDGHRDFYYGPRLAAPWKTVEDWRMPTDPGDCSGDVADDIWLHFHHNMRINSFRKEPYVVRYSGVYDDVWNGIKPGDSLETIKRQPHRNRGYSVTFGAEGSFERGSSVRGYAYQAVGPTVYSCDDPQQLAGSVQNLANDGNAFLNHALQKMRGANPGAGF